MKYDASPRRGLVKWSRILVTTRLSVNLKLQDNTCATKPRNTCHNVPIPPLNIFFFWTCLLLLLGRLQPSSVLAMPPTPHAATTSTRAKASFKKNGPRLPQYEMKRIERGAILDRRAEEVKEREAKRKRAKEKQRLKEAREREGRAKMGLGLATQLVGFSHTQRGMKVGFVLFVCSLRHEIALWSTRFCLRVEC
jgi:hypothetical protein